jgi:nucleotide-binding universal stress UspA family protein
MRLKRDRRDGMYNKVVVPLDGSDLAEIALPHLQEIALGCNIPEILLISVTQKVTGKVSSQSVPPERILSDGHIPRQQGPLPVGAYSTGILYVGQPTPSMEVAVRIGRMASSALKYLTRVASQLQTKGFNVGVAVLVGNPAEEIIRFSKEEKADLIIMSSRGKSGFSRWDLGNIADRVIRASDIPVILVKPKRGFKETKARRGGKST